VFRIAATEPAGGPPELALTAGSETTLRAELGRALAHLNRASQGAILVAAADLLASTSVNAIGQGFGAPGYFHTTANPEARIFSAGGICEDAMAGLLSGISTFGRHIGVGASYGAFLAPLGHIAARLHAIGNQARQEIHPGPYRPMILVCGHAGLKTGEDGPTHADPQALQLLQGNFPRGTLVTLTPWDPREIWPLLAAALVQRPAIIAVFVTRPTERVLDRQALGLAPPEQAAHGVYALRPGRPGRDGTLVLSGSEVTYVLVESVLPQLDQQGVDLAIYYVSSAELFDLRPQEDQERLFPAARAREALGITGFTQPTLDRFVRSDLGRKLGLHPFRKGRYLGSGSGPDVLAQAGLDGKSQRDAILEYVAARRSLRGLGA
jgi:transketolase